MLQQTEGSRTRPHTKISDGPSFFAVLFLMNRESRISMFVVCGVFSPSTSIAAPALFSNVQRSIKQPLPRFSKSTPPSS